MAVALFAVALFRSHTISAVDSAKEQMRSPRQYNLRSPLAALSRNQVLRLTSVTIKQ